MASSLALFKLGSWYPFVFGARLGVSLAAPQRVSTPVRFKIASFLSFERLALLCPFVLVPVWVPPSDHLQRAPRQSRPLFRGDVTEIGSDCVLQLANASDCKCFLPVAAKRLK